MCITTDARHTTNSEVEWLQLKFPVLTLGKSCTLQKRQNEASKATVYVEPDIMRSSKNPQSGYAVLIAVREVDGGTNDLEKQIEN